jgi:ABC-type bacteriocin/lantibiotic exporter with double-glycine peptidase domain
MINIKPLKQINSYCGPYCLKMVFDYYAFKVKVKDIAKVTETAVSEGNLGTSPSNMVKAAKYFGFNSYYKEESSLKEIKKLLNKGVPVIVNWFSEDEGHYSVVVGMDKRKIYLIDPEYGKKVSVSLIDFQKIWFDYTGDYVKSKKDFRVRPLIVIIK